MQIKVSLTVAVAACGLLRAQEPPPPAPQTPPAAQQAPADDPVYVRRISLGLTLSVMGLPVIKDADTERATTNPAFNGVYKTEAANRRAGYGAHTQIAITERIAATAGVFIRKGSYKFNTDIHEGVDNPNTPLVDERKYSAQKEETSFRFYDIPVLLRYYAKSRYDEGARWFVQGGPTWRKAARIRTSIESTAGTTVTCCETTPAPARKSITGYTAGFGVQLIDPVGIRVVPEFRFTRWRGATFDNSLTTFTERNQVEIMFSFTF